MSIDDGVQVELFLRSGVSAAVEKQQRRVRTRLERTLPAGSLSVHEHPKRVPVVDGSAVFERYREVYDWASEAGVSLSPFFARRETYDPTAGDVREMVTLPVLWLTLVEGASIRASYPHVDGEVATVSDAVAELTGADGRRASDAAD